ncbi:UDP-N-acetylmuramoyl-L-alanyl-D-glutamate--2,6-diaminopimelate ligase [Pokkaliibacter sp. MBI-7]|uniref:UDP-N-acetylmuramoyl-L-alanyl-D-glutamate--2, 6-diaminopimelate ligase n=1 Tax=Pokkaliibacter sp. MBI-7 TaxID=3040600 RepID=UPI00244813E9|nr:UDP-N-acetylmuramoyl-L-alanyl-D-glutamate--2,6-diaminopimelate ligase [Pokkaliibacter sp. MBI-7]MDH2431628.1 UDP-N-acetylmuramoyl-L-alanyl-D-glutamate--2,6-diaminopimelate ligase [Pokkaliibacter sp. MBI-7]
MSTSQPVTLGEWLTAESIPVELAQQPLAPITLDSRRVESGYWYVITVLDSDKAQQFYLDAVERGAAMVLVDASLFVEERAGCPVVKLAELKSRLGELMNCYFASPSRQMDVIGVTGTNGKTSVSQFIASALAFLGKPCAVLGTLGYGMPGHLQTATHTTPDIDRVHGVMAQMQVQQGAKAVAMEVSSHALTQGRVDGVTFQTAVFTNLSRDHLDYHGDMASYAVAKQRLFQCAELQHAVINLDDPWAASFIEVLAPTVNLVTYATEQDATIYLGLWHPEPDGMRLEFMTPRGRVSFSTPLLGRFNVSNLLAVAAVLYAQGYSVEQISAALAQVQRVPGRMESFRQQGKPLLVVDYAHTPDALVKALSALREHVQGRLWCVFGCGGDRDRGKRPLMAAAVESQADFIILTQDNPRTESSQQIIADTQTGFMTLDHVSIITDREAAIRYAVEHASPDDMVLIAGKGHEEYQDIAGVKHAFSDRALAAELLGVVL